MVSNNYRVYWTNHGYFSQEQFVTLEEAKQYGRDKYLEHTIYQGNNIVGWWRMFGGWCSYEGLIC